MFGGQVVGIEESKDGGQPPPFIFRSPPHTTRAFLPEGHSQTRCRVRQVLRRVQQSLFLRRAALPRLKSWSPNPQGCGSEIYLCSDACRPARSLPWLATKEGLPICLTPLAFYQAESFFHSPGLSAIEWETAAGK